MINLKRINRFAKATSGGTMIGYSLIAALIATSALGATRLLGSRLDHVYGNIGTTISGGAQDPSAPPPVPSISIGNASGGEDSTITFVVTLSEAAADTVTVAYATTNGTAEEWADYMSAGGTLTLSPGQTSASIDVSTLDDGETEGDETFFLNLSSPTNATVANGTATGTIVDDDVIPSLSIADASSGEGTAVTFTVTLSAPAAQDVSFDYATSNGTATNPSDYLSDAGTLTITAGQTSTTFNVFGADDSVFEGNESFTVTLSNPTNATIADGNATGTIIEDEVAPTITLSSTAISTAQEGATLQFDVLLSYAVLTEEITVTLAYIDGTATAGIDYETTVTSVVIPAGHIGATVTVPHTQDLTYEGNETFTVEAVAASGGNAVVGSGNQVTITIENDDDPPALEVEGTSLTSEAEGSWGSVHLTLDRVSELDVVVTASTASGSAQADSDFVPFYGAVFVIPAGTTEYDIPITLIHDTIPEGTESFVLSIDALEGASISFFGFHAEVYISDDD